MTTGAGMQTRFTAADGALIDETEPVAHPEGVFAMDSAAATAARQISAAHWGTDPCNGQVALEWVSLDDTVNAQSSWTNPTSAYDNPGQNGDCKVQFNATAEFDWPKFCTVMVHELGHLVGKPHAADPRDVMAAYYTVPLAACTATLPPGIPAPKADAPATAHKPAASAASTRKVVKHKKATMKKPT